MYAVLYLLTTLLVVVTTKLQDKPFPYIIKMVLLGALALSAIIIYFSFQPEKYEWNKQKKLLFGLFYLLSFCMLVFSDKINFYNFYLLGIVLVALVFDSNAGIFLNMVFSLYLIEISQIEIEWLTFYLLFGSMFCMITLYMRQLKQFIPVTVTMLALQVTGMLLIYEFNYNELLKNEILYYLGSTLLIILIAFFYSSLVLEKGTKELDIEEIPLEEKKRIEEQKERVKFVEEEIKENRTGNRLLLTDILKKDFELHIRLKEYSDELYNHSIQVAELACQVATELRANRFLARAGGLYHEVGQIMEQDYVIDGIELANEYRFPLEVIEIIKQHNPEYAKPTSIEAAIVMLSDNVVSALDYMKANPSHKKLGNEKLVENIFQLRITKGLLDDVSLSIEDFSVLKRLYIDFLKSKIKE